ncbi:metal-dependent hydrolase [Bacillus sp. HMF5848]|uniref:metal-dependent hydrolase n=1 Tax=Bacillus sp. HMF5848 TaxID=2495421 RepID=UPI000F77ED1E|nr:metal-dependent hydrolase [Bacillus sp. HMF5848]RSK28149.1 metal-dependent hydrolase [Bacillus sp. HMF5848]
MKVSFHGHSVVKIETNSKVILIDPFISGNGQTDLNANEVRADVILLTHGHNDHVGDTVSIAKRTGALVVAPFELAGLMGKKGCQVHPMHIGGAHEFDFGRVKFTQAFHGSSYEEEDGTIVYTGMPGGILFEVDGQTIYHAGDTALFSDMKMIGERNNIDLAFLPIGDNFTMGPEDAATAAEWLNAKKVVPMHYNTFPLIEQDADAFVKMLPNGTGQVLKPGESVSI